MIMLSKRNMFKGKLVNKFNGFSGSKGFESKKSEPLALQAQLEVVDEDIIPKHEVITRRRQFRMKKEKKEKQRLKKESKKAEKEEVKKLKEAGLWVPKKRGRKAAEKGHPNKVKETKQQTGKRKANKAAANSKSKTSKQDNTDNTQEAVQANNEKEQGEREVVSKEQAHAESTSFVAPLPKAGRRKSRLGKLKKVTQHFKDTQELNSCQVCEGEVDGKTEAASMEQAQEQSVVVPKKRSKAGRKSKGGKKRGTQDAPHGTKAEKTKTEKNEPEVQQKKKKTPEETAKGETKTKKARKTKEISDVQPDPVVTALVKSTLHECRDSKCTRPSFVWADYDKKIFEFSVYWSRQSVGVKLDRGFLPNKTTEKNRQKKCRICYFGCKSPCTYSNLILANLYVL